MSSYIDALNQTTAAATGKTTTKSGKEMVMGKEDFLMLLVAQLQNQDPLSPDDPTEFTAQLAQFSSLEQLTSLNDGMADLVTANADSDRFATLNTIGKNVAYNSADFTFTGEPVELGYQLDGQATSVTLSLKHNGVSLATIKGDELTTGNHFMSWDGELANGSKAPIGKYEIIIEAEAATDESVGASPLQRAEVTGVDLQSAYGGTLVTKTGTIGFTSILGVYEPGTVARTAAATE